MKIENLNPWWKTGKIPEEFSTLEKRGLFKEITRCIKEKQIIVLTGLRRTGKTTLMHHVIDYLLKFYPRENIFYYSFDLMDDNIGNVLFNFLS